MHRNIEVYLNNNMKKIIKFWQIVLIDALGVIFIVGAALTGWLPGPGGIPLFIVGLSLFAINHDWAQKYIDLAKQYADHISDLIFLDKKAFRVGYDILAPILLIAGVTSVYTRGNSKFLLGLGIFMTFMGITVFLGNRSRYKKLKAKITAKKS